MSDPDASQPTPKPQAPLTPGATPTGYQRTTGGKGFKWEPPTPEKLAQLLPQYHIEALIGRGGMGAVYKGTQKALERPVAIKILPPEVDDEDASYTERFKNEAKIMARLEHPAIVPVYDFGETSEGQLYFVMGFINGTDIHQMIASQGRLPPEHALAITAHVCDALGYAHQHGVIHRDIKPSNVLINMEGQVKVADFGLAKAQDTSQSSGLTKTGLAMGTPDYVAPETLSIGMIPDGRADLYAVGVMLYQMLTGQVPRGMFEMPSKLTGCDPRFDAIVAKAMKYDREERYPTATDLRRDLDVILTAPLVQSGGQSSAAIPKAAMPRKPTGKPPQPDGRRVRQNAEAAPANTPDRTLASAPTPKSKAPLFIGLGAAAAIGIGAVVMLGGEGRRVRQNADSAPASTPPNRTLASAPTASAPKPAPPPPKPVPTPVSSSPSLPLSKSSEPQFPPGKWVKVFTKFEDLPGELRNRDSGWKWNDGWLQQTNPNKNKTFSVPGFSARNAAIRARIRYSAELDGFLFLSGMPGGTTGRLGHHRFRIGASGLHLEKWAGKNYTRVHQQDLPTGLQDGVMGEFAFLNGRVFARGHDILLPQARDDDLQEGRIGYYGSAEIRDIEVINLDGLSEAEALKILGVDEKGNDLRKPAVADSGRAAGPPAAASGPTMTNAGNAPATPGAALAGASALPSAPAAVTTKFPPSQWVKVFTKLEELPEELRKPDVNAKFEDGWLIIPRRPSGDARRLNLPALQVGRLTNMAVRLTLKGTQIDSAKFLSLLSLRYDDMEARYQYMVRQYASSLQVAAIGLQTDKVAARPRDEILLTHPYAAPMDRSWRLEFAVVGNRLIARVDEQLIPLLRDERVKSGRTSGYIITANAIRDIEVINLDGIPEAEALRILGVDEQGNDLRALAAKQEQQKAEMAKQADAMAAIPELKALHEQFMKLQAERVTAPFEAEVAALNTSYLGGLDRKIAEEKKAGHLDGVLALEAEKALVAGQQPVPAADDDKTTATLKDLRRIYREAHAKLEATRAANLKLLTDPLDTRLKQLESTLTQANRIDHAKTVREYRAGLGKEGSAGTPARSTAATNQAAGTGGSPANEGEKLSDKEVVEWALSHQGYVTVFKSGEYITIQSANQIPKGSFEVTELDFAKAPEPRSQITDAELEKLAGLKELRQLQLQWRKGFEGSFLAKLTGLRKLTYVTLSDSSFEAAHLPLLFLLPSLETLRCDASLINEDGDKLPKRLKTLAVHGTPSQELLTALRNYRELSGLKMVNFPLTVAQAEIIAQLQGLTNLEIGFSDDPAILSELSKLPRLNMLVFPSPNFAIPTLAGLKQLPDLRHLRLHAETVQKDPAGLISILAELKKLERVELTTNPALAAQARTLQETLQKALPKIKISVL